MDLRAHPVAQLEVGGDKIGVHVGEENVADRQALRLSIGDVVVHVALRVDDDGGLRVVVTDEVGGVGETAEVVLLQQHGVVFHRLCGRSGKLRRVW